MPREGVLGQATRIDPVPADHDALDSLRGREDLGGGELVLRTADGTEISLPSSLLRLVVSAANNLAAGRAVMAIPAEVMLTPAEAAELLGLSRPFVARLLERGDIPSELLPESRHRRIKLEDVLAFQDRRERRSEGRRRIADIAAAADLPYLLLLFVARVFIDTNVLFPFSIMDLMLALSEDGIHDVMWSDNLLDEWERVIVRERHRSPDAAAVSARSDTRPSSAAHRSDGSPSCPAEASTLASCSSSPLTQARLRPARSPHPTPPPPRQRSPGPPPLLRLSAPMISLTASSQHPKTGEPH